MEKKNDFTKGKISTLILKLAVPMTLAQLINVLYNIVDRMYIGRIPGEGRLALTGLGLVFPIISILNAFANLCGMGGAPLCSIARGEGKEEHAEHIMGNSFGLLLFFGILLSVGVFLFREPLLYAFGASEATYIYAENYLSIYLIGTLFVMVSLGMNPFINSQGFGKIGMLTILIGACINLVLDPIFIFALNMGVKGAALATILSQIVSSVWVLSFLCGKKTILKIKLRNMLPDWKIIGKILALGASGFTMSLTNSAVQVMCNTSLLFFGGDIYVGVMTITNSIREVIQMPISGVGNAAQPIMGYNYGAGTYRRVRESIKFLSKVCIFYSLAAMIILMAFPGIFVRIFNADPELIAACIPSLRIYFAAYAFMAFQMAGQNTFLALNKSKQAIFFSLLRKAIIVIPLIYILPRIGNLGVNGVFLAEPISDVIGGTACFGTMLLTLWPKLKKDKSEQKLDG